MTATFSKSRRWQYKERHFLSTLELFYWAVVVLERILLQNVLLGIRPYKVGLGQFYTIGLLWH